MQFFRKSSLILGLLAAAPAFAGPMDASAASGNLSVTATTNTNTGTNTDAATTAPVKQLSGKALEANVLAKIHVTNLDEIGAGQLAKSKGHSARTRAFGDTLVMDHTKADRLLMTVVRKSKLSLPADPSPLSEKDAQATETMKAGLEKLKTLDGAAFDREFALQMKAGHDNTIDILRQAEVKLRGTRTAKLITTLLPTLHKHDDIAARLDRTPATGE